MDALAYLQLALVYESTEESHSPAMELSLPNSAWIPVLTMTVGLTILGTAPNAVALQRGDRGDEVVQLQLKLKRLGFFSAKATGYYGSITEQAVKDYQATKGIQPLGVVRPKTETALSQTAVQNLDAPAKPNVATNSVSKGDSPAETLRERGGEVAQIQESLLNLGYFNGRITAYYGSYTEAAVIRFQKDHGLLADGIVGPQTRAKLSS
jgi:peptidoglycan hydrolase-like protein with peptidoglycan-binding domain